MQMTLRKDTTRVKTKSERFFGDFFKKREKSECLQSEGAIETGIYLWERLPGRLRILRGMDKAAVQRHS